MLFFLIYEKNDQTFKGIFVILFLSEAKYKTKYWTRLKTLNSKQILQGLPLALAQPKAGNK